MNRKTAINRALNHERTQAIMRTGYPHQNFLDALNDAGFDVVPLNGWRCTVCGGVVRFDGSEKEAINAEP